MQSKKKSTGAEHFVPSREALLMDQREALRPLLPRPFQRHEEGGPCRPLAPARALGKGDHDARACGARRCDVGDELTYCGRLGAG